MTSTPPNSPLDPFLASFLAAIDARDRGFMPGQESSTLADEMGVERAFVDMLFASARMRGLLKPAYGRGSKVVWQVSATGTALIERVAPLAQSEPNQNAPSA